MTRQAIRGLGYGTNAKLFAGLSARPWRAAGRSGECLNGLGIQTVWEDHARPGTSAGALTIFAGEHTAEHSGCSRKATGRDPSVMPGTPPDGHSPSGSGW